MGSGDNRRHHQKQQAEEYIYMKKKILDNTHIDVHHHVPKGCMAVMVGHEGEEQKRFVIPVIYIYHPLFLNLLKEAEEEYGFHHRGGPINIPCNVQHFSDLIQDFINKDDDHFFYHHHHHHHHIIWCFKA